MVQHLYPLKLKFKNRKGKKQLELKCTTAKCRERMEDVEGTKNLSFKKKTAKREREKK